MDEIDERLGAMALCIERYQAMSVGDREIMAAALASKGALVAAEAGTPAFDVWEHFVSIRVAERRSVPVPVQVQCPGTRNYSFTDVGRTAGADLLRRCTLPEGR